MGRSQRYDLLLPFAAALFACSSQVEPDYRGEPVASLHGFVASSSALGSADGLRAAIIWNTTEPGQIGEQVDVEGGFPASFSLDLFAAPPAEAELKTITDYCVRSDELSSVGRDAPCDGHRIPKGTGVGMWAGFIAAIDSDLDEGEIELESIRGIDVDHVLVYFDHDDPRSSPPPPADPSTDELAAALELVNLGAQPDSYRTGYQLWKFNPEYQAWRTVIRECEWSELCVHWNAAHEHPDAIEERLQNLADWGFQRCTERFPENPTCSARPEEFAEGESMASAECRARHESLDHDCSSSTSVSRLIEAPGGLEEPIAIQMGMTLWDASW